MSVIVTSDTRLCVSGITGSEGTETELGAADDRAEAGA